MAKEHAVVVFPARFEIALLDGTTMSLRLPKRLAYTTLSACTKIRVSASRGTCLSELRRPTDKDPFQAGSGEREWIEEWNWNENEGIALIFGQCCAHLSCSTMDFKDGSRAFSGFITA